MNKFAVVAMAAVTFLITFDSSEAQILRRFRANVRQALVPQGRPQQIGSSFTPAQTAPQYPALQGGNSGPQQLTPYSRLTAEQRRAPQRFVEPRLNAPAPVGNPANQSIGQNNDAAKVRIVTYYDPRSGGSFQRRYLIPRNAQAPSVEDMPGQAVTRGRSMSTQPTVVANSESSAATANTLPTASRQSLVPPIQFATQQPDNVSPTLSPTLSGPSLATPVGVAAVSTAEPIAASIDLSVTPSGIKTASAEIPDLSGITVEPAAMASPDETSQAMFFNQDDSDVSLETNDVPSYSVLEEVEQE